jgi:hypothetical protein
VCCVWVCGGGGGGGGPPRRSSGKLWYHVQEGVGWDAALQMTWELWCRTRVFWFVMSEFFGVHWHIKWASSALMIACLVMIAVISILSLFHIHFKDKFCQVHLGDSESVLMFFYATLLLHLSGILSRPSAFIIIYDIRTLALTHSMFFWWYTAAEGTL